MLNNTTRLVYCRLSGCCLPLLLSAQSLPSNPAISLTEFHSPLQSLKSLHNPALISCNWLWLYYTLTQWEKVNTNNCRASNPNYQVTFTHKWHIYSPHLFGLPLRMNGMQRMCKCMHVCTFYHLQSDHGPSIKQNIQKEQHRRQECFHLQSISPAFPLIITLAIIYLFIF